MIARCLQFASSRGMILAEQGQISNLTTPQSDQVSEDRNHLVSSQVSSPGQIQIHFPDAPPAAELVKVTCCVLPLYVQVLFVNTFAAPSFTLSSIHSAFTVSWSGHGAVQVIGKTGHKGKPLFYVAKAPCQLCVISLVRQATASGFTTGLQELQELPHNPPIQTRRSAINLW